MSTVSRVPPPAAVPRPWVAAYPPGVPATYRYPPVDLTRLLDDAVRDFPDVVAVEDDETALRYRELGAAVEALAATLAAGGVGGGDEVAITTGERAVTVIAAFAAWRLGAVVALGLPAVPVSAAVVADDAHAALLAAPAGRAPLVLRAPPGALRRRWWRRSDSELRRIINDRRRTAPRSAVPADAPALRTGTSTVSHRALVASCFQVRLWVPDVRAGRERLVAATSLHSPAALAATVLHAVLAAGTLVLVGADRSRLTAAVRRGGTLMVTDRPVELAPLAAQTGRQLRTILTLDGPVPTDLVTEVERRGGGTRLRELYRPPGVLLPTHGSPVYGRARAGTVGVPLPDTVAVVAGRDGWTTTSGSGQLLVAGPQTDQDGWVDAGTTASVDELGFLRPGEFPAAEVGEAGG